MSSKQKQTRTRAARGRREAWPAWVVRLVLVAALLTLSVWLCPSAWARAGAGVRGVEPWLAVASVLGVAYVVARKRVRTQAWTISRAWLGPVLLGVAAGCCAIDHPLAVAARLPLVIGGCALSVYGWELVRRFPTAWLPLACVTLPTGWLVAADRVAGAVVVGPAGGLIRWLNMPTGDATGYVRVMNDAGESAALDPAAWTLTLGVALLAVALGQRHQRARIAWAAALVPVVVVVAQTLRVVAEAGAWTLTGDAFAAWTLPGMLAATLVGALVLQHQGDPSWADFRRVRLWRQCTSHATRLDRWSPLAAACVLGAAGVLL